MSNKRRREAPVWEFFNVDEKEERLAKCKLSNKAVPRAGEGVYINYLLLTVL